MSGWKEKKKEASRDGLQMLLIKTSRHLFLTHITHRNKFTFNYSSLLFCALHPSSLPLRQKSNLLNLPNRKKLPLRLSSIHKSLEDTNLFFQRDKPQSQLMLDLLQVRSQLRIEILPIRRRRHGRAEDRFHHEVMIRFERRPVRVAKGRRQFFRLHGHVGP